MAHVVVNQFGSCAHMLTTGTTDKKTQKALKLNTMATRKHWQWWLQL